MDISIYTLSDPDTGEVRYVGKTKNPHKRLKEHVADARNLHRYGNGRRRICKRYAWLISLITVGKMPIYQIIETVDCSRNSKAWEPRERFWIAHHNSSGRLVNSTEGGESGTTTGMKFGPPSEEKRRKISETIRRTYADPKNRWGCVLGGKAIKGYKYPREVVARRAASNRLQWAARPKIDRINPRQGAEVVCKDILSGHETIFLSFSQAACLLGMKKQTIHQAIKRGSLAFKRYEFRYLKGGINDRPKLCQSA